MNDDPDRGAAWGMSDRFFTFCKFCETEAKVLVDYEVVDQVRLHLQSIFCVTNHLVTKFFLAYLIGIVCLFLNFDIKRGNIFKDPKYKVK